MTKTITKLNSTGSLYRNNINNDIVSYSTPIYREFQTRRGLIKVFNDTYYSTTTCKHQAKIRYYQLKADVILNHCPYGDWSLNTALKNEITMTQYELEKLQNKKRKLGIRQAEQKENLTNRLTELQQLQEELL